jgi:hypothetical protein
VRFVDQHITQQVRAFFRQDARRFGRTGASAGCQNILDQQVGVIIMPAADDAALGVLELDSCGSGSRVITSILRSGSSARRNAA